MQEVHRVMNKSLGYAITSMSKLEQLETSLRASASCTLARDYTFRGFAETAREVNISSGEPRGYATNMCEEQRQKRAVDRSGIHRERKSRMSSRLELLKVPVTNFVLCSHGYEQKATMQLVSQWMCRRKKVVSDYREDWYTV